MHIDIEISEMLYHYLMALAQQKNISLNRLIQEHLMGIVVSNSKMRLN